MLYIAKMFYRSSTGEHGQFDLIIQAEMVESAICKLKVSGKSCITRTDLVPRDSDIFFDSIIEIDDPSDDVILAGFASYSEKFDEARRCAIPDETVDGIDAFSYPDQLLQPMFTV